MYLKIILFVSFWHNQFNGMEDGAALLKRQPVTNTVATPSPVGYASVHAFTLLLHTYASLNMWAIFNMALYVALLKIIFSLEVLVSRYMCIHVYRIHLF